MKLTDLQNCQIRSAIVNLVQENISTRAAITDQTIDRYAWPVVMDEGDPRVARLQTLFSDLRAEPSALAQIEMRLRVRVRCADTRWFDVTGTRTSSDGSILLDIDGEIVRTTLPFRRELEMIVGPHAK